MLSLLQTGPGNRKLPRREMLRAGAMALGGLSLTQTDLLRAGTAAGGNVLSGKSVIFLFMHGGPSSAETFDPKMEIPVEYRAMNGDTATKLPGVRFGSLFPKLAQRADRLAVVRSYATGSADHGFLPLISEHTEGAHMGAQYARVAGVNHPRNGLPTNVNLYMPSVDTGVTPTPEGVRAYERLTNSGRLGTMYRPFVPGGGGNFQEDMRIKVPAERLDDRRALLEQLDALRRKNDHASMPWGLQDKLQRQAFDVILGGAAQAFDLSKEDPRTLARYDTTPVLNPAQVTNEAFKPGEGPRRQSYIDNAKTFGKLLLLARRLCEAGCGFVTVSTDFIWDFHWGLARKMEYAGPVFDHAVAAFLDDVRERGLSDKILLVCCGEMGRSPGIAADSSRIAYGAGRHHWGELAPLLLAGGGLKMGQVIGQSDKYVGAPAVDPYGNGHLTTTILRTLFNADQMRVTSGVPGDLLRLTTADPIAQLF